MDYLRCGFCIDVAHYDWYTQGISSTMEDLDFFWCDLTSVANAKCNTIGSGVGFMAICIVCGVSPSATQLSDKPPQCTSVFHGQNPGVEICLLSSGDDSHFASGPFN